MAAPTSEVVNIKEIGTSRSASLAPTHLDPPLTSFCKLLKKMWSYLFNYWFTSLEVFFGSVNSFGKSAACKQSK